MNKHATVITKTVRRFLARRQVCPATTIIFLKSSSQLLKLRQIKAKAEAAERERVERERIEREKLARSLSFTFHIHTSCVIAVEAERLAAEAAIKEAERLAAEAV